MDEHLERLKSYVENAKNHGQNNDQIRVTLQRIGWQDEYIDQVLPPSTPKPNASKPVKKAGSKTMAFVFVAILLLIVGGIAYWYFFAGNKSTQNTSQNTQTVVTVEHKDNGISFRYPGTWKKITYSELLELSSADVTGYQDPTLAFLEASKYTELQSYLTSLPAETGLEQLGEILLKVSASTSLSLVSYEVSAQCPQGSVCTPKSSAEYAKEIAGEETKTIYSVDGSSSFSTSNPVLTEKIGTTVIDETTCYWVANGTASEPYVVLVIPGTTVVTELFLKQVSTPQAVTGDIKDILNSIQVL